MIRDFDILLIDVWFYQFRPFEVSFSHQVQAVVAVGRTQFVGTGFYEVAIEIDIGNFSFFGQLFQS